MKNKTIRILVIFFAVFTAANAYAADLLEEAKAFADKSSYKEAYEKQSVAIEEMKDEINNLHGIVEYYKGELANLKKPQPSVDRSYNEAAGRLWASAWSLQHDGVFKKMGKEKEVYLEKAVETYRRIVIDYQYSTKAEEAQYRIGRLYYKFIKDDARAAEEFEKYLNMYPNGMFANEVKDTLIRLKKE